jgi:hypothetical protein
MLHSADLHLDHGNLTMLLLCCNTEEPRSSTRADHKLLMSSVKHRVSADDSKQRQRNRIWSSKAVVDQMRFCTLLNRFDHHTNRPHFVDPDSDPSSNCILKIFVERGKRVVAAAAAAGGGGGVLFLPFHHLKYPLKKLVGPIFASFDFRVYWRLSISRETC